MLTPRRIAIPGPRYINSPLSERVQFQNDSGTDVDPTTVIFKTCSPSGVAASYVYGTDGEVEKESVGDYVATVTPDEAGRWFFRWESTGTDKTIALEGTFLIQTSVFFDSPFTDYI
jgi:hypothetical protein